MDYKDKSDKPSLPKRSASVKAPSKPKSSPSMENGVLRDFREHIKKNSPISFDVSTLSSILDVIRHKESIDDRKMLLEHALTFISRLPEGSMKTKLQNGAVELLYNDLTHPPATNIGNDYGWRKADGGYNNIDAPDMGRAGTPYSRSVQQQTALTRFELPDPGLIFDTLLRRDGFVQHPAGLSSLMFSFAALVIHSVFRTSHENVHINDTSSYVDLSVLYGSDQEEQDRVRDRAGRGLLHKDCFAESRLLLLPPPVCVLLVLFNRNHNYIATKLLEINERGTFFNPDDVSADDPEGKAKLLAQDEELFQIARLVNCGWFGSVVFSDYFSAILGLVRQGNSWSLSPFGEIRKDDHSVFERGKGNSCSVEFNMLYRWHATTSKEDEEWVGKMLSHFFGGKKPEDITREDMKAAAVKMKQMDHDIEHWTFGNMSRNEDGGFTDGDLANILHNATEHAAGAFRARGTPAVMRLHEIMGIEQSRAWGVCSLNNFRQFLGLKPYASFREWNPNPEIADAAEKLYGGDINKLELYPGLQAEEAKPVREGAGLCPGYTISRAILSDAIALTRGDRFFTHDYTPANLTSWGYADCQRDPNAFGFGSTLGRLLLRTLPNNFSENSAYSFFPLMRPDAMEIHLKELGVLDQYDLSRPVATPKMVSVTDHSTIVKVLNSKDFKPPYSQRASKIIPGKGFFTVETEMKQRAVAEALTGSPEASDTTAKYFYEKTRELLDVNSYTLVGGTTKAVDLVRDVLTDVPVFFAAEELAGIQLKTKQTPHGTYTPSELYDKLGEVFSFIFLEVEASKRMVLESKVKGHVKELLGHIKQHLNITATQRLSVSNVIDTISSMFSKQKKTEHHAIVQRLNEISHSSNQVANNILALMVGMTMELSLALTNTVNLYLGSDHDSDIREAAKKQDTNFDQYIWEAFRLDPPFRSVRRVALNDIKVNEVSAKKDEVLFLDIAAANVDKAIFANAGSIDLSRPASTHVKADSALRFIGESFTLKIMNEVLRAVFSYTNIRRGPGKSGELKRFKDSSRRDLLFAYLDKQDMTSPWPTSMVVQYEV